MVVDATLLSALLDTMLDWSLRHACTAVDLRLDTKAWPTHARLVCRYGHTPQDRVQTVAPAARGAATPSRVIELDCLSWQLMAQLVRTMALHIDRADTESNTALTLEFPHTVNDSLEGAAAIECDSACRTHRRFTTAGRCASACDCGQARGAQSDPPDPLADGSGIRQRELRRCRARVLPTGPAASDRLRIGSIHDSAFDRLRNDIKLQSAELAWIEIVEQGEAFEISSFGGMSMARVGRNAIGSSLPSALMFELAKDV